ncbi:alpha/beta fold hydrolase [Bordetella trematum]|uniref:alpha/beta fold hydrolase n=1 Tax=Bordetella trematum TaxID=123899 RepID=UPI0015C5795A|nr:alpha/beta fold hydrolase [Bordetella trematum]
MSSVAIEDHLIETPAGALFARRWRPAAGAGAAPLVLMHDSLGCVALWRDFPQQLARASGREVVAYDRLGFGQSAAHPARLRPDFVSAEAREDFARMRAQLGITTFVALGHSVGGGMAIACAAAWGEDCRGLITESAQAFVEPRTLEGIRAARAGFAQPGQLDRLARYHGDKAAWVLSAWIDTWLAEDFAGWNLDHELQQVRCPALALHGDQDEYGSLAHPDRIATLARGQQHVFAGCGHVPHREQPEAVLAVILPWLAARE